MTKKVGKVSKLADGTKSNPKRFFAHVQRNRHLKLLIVALRADELLCGSLPYWWGGEDHPSLPELAANANAPHYPQAVVHKKLLAVASSKGPGPGNFHPFMVQILADFLADFMTGAGKTPALFSKTIKWFHMIYQKSFPKKGFLLFFTELAWQTSPPILLIQPSPSGRTCYPFDEWRPHGGLSLHRLCKGIRLRKPPASFDQAYVVN